MASPRSASQSRKPWDEAVSGKDYSDPQPICATESHLTESQSDLGDKLVASGHYQSASEVLRLGLCRLEREEAEIRDIPARITAGLDRARRADLAESSGEDAISPAFASAFG
ncbi:MAG: type II toxin-antitoxin system ParD family antitoxin [Paracoccus sp. (in: a-proteobacteria)]|nr:type II toxin-antitoxin system ParD family antitoxin [Paracoccus sp. (in: a-proteobacteria)]